ncbi:MAG: glycosyltransferase [Vicinamibacterales bacterium]
MAAPDPRARPIALCITELAFGGTPRSVQRLAEGLHAGGLDVRVLTLRAKADVAFELEAAGIPVTALDIEARGVPGASLALARWLRAERIGLLHTFLFHANLLGRVVGRAAGVPVILASERSTESAKLRRRVWLDRLTWWLASGWTTNAAAAARVMSARERIPAARIALVPSGVDAALFAPRPRDAAFRARVGVAADDLLIVCVGRIDRYKGQEVVLEAFAEIARERADARLLFVGDGRHRAALEASAAPLGPRVRFAGAVSDVRPALASADVFVLASEEEGMASAILEAMAMAVPVVATAVGGTPEIVTPGENGLLVAPRRPGQLAQALRRLLADPGLRATLGQAGRARVLDQFTLARTVSLSAALYTGLLADRGLRPARRAGDAGSDQVRRGA